MRYVKETLDGAATAVMLMAGALPSNPPYEYEEVTEDAYNAALSELTSRPVGGEEPPAAPAGLTNDEVDYVRGLIAGSGGLNNE